MFFRLLLFFLLAGSAVFAQEGYDPSRRFPVEALRADYVLLRRALEEGHPGLYWYTPKARMDAAFDTSATQLDHPLTEEEFRLVLSPLIAQLRCGHTGVFLSKKAERYFKKARPLTLPFETGFYSGKLYITENRSNDSTLRVGNQLLAVEGKPAELLAAQMRAIIASDGFNQTFKNVRISSNFPGYYRLMYGHKDTVAVTVRDSAGTVRTLHLAHLTPRQAGVLPKVVGQPAPNTPQSKPVTPRPERFSRGDRRRMLRFLAPDSALGGPPVALLNVASFDDNGYRRFYRRAFRQIEEHGSRSLILNLRANGGGYSAAGRRLLQYLLDSSFRFSSSMIAPKKHFSFGNHLNQRFMRFFVRNFFSKKTGDGRLALKSGDDWSKPVKRHHFSGDVYVLTNGGTFSAAAIVAADLQAFGGATVVGRETGGGRWGCNAAYIPFLTLPNTGVRVRFPLYRVLTDVPGPNLGHGVKPDYEVNYTIRDVLKNEDLDVARAMELIRQRQQKSRETTLK
jgi:hypothetical protein